MDKPTPLINSSMMANHAGQVVRIVGKAAQLAGSELVVQTSDQGNVAVDLARDTQLRGEGYVEIVGKVDENGERLREFTSVDFGDKLDMALVEAVVQLSAKVPALFAESSN
ncbi:replication factor A protein 3 [Tilletiopsis washingtonensis]|uniref:Replication factor A protein 3 n=1 Tax=Tilletiopsis washingtonensis TaxID=58919 RepID=A0A316ZKI5_9BASI|nr:replication factor A protein 3 [Tilletiopsis washingtonensis]PWO00896.1 replication factor A protein 3 [Tilletiopsis washingtonensis]